MPRGVKKVVEPTEEVKVEEAKVGEVATEEAAPVEEAKTEEPAAVEEVKEEVPAEDVTAEAELVAEAAVEEKPVEEIKEEEPAKKEEKKAAAKNEWQFVTNLRVFPSPADLTVSKLVSGNVKVVGEAGDFKKVEYMKHGFGLVTGYTKSL